MDEASGELPSDLEDDPAVFEVNFSELPIVVYSISGTCGLPCLKDIAEDLEDDIEAIPGVLEVEVTGGLEREIRIEVSPEKLAYYGIPITAFQRVVSSENINTSGGVLRLGDGRFQLRVPGEFQQPEDIFGLVVGVHDGQPVYLKDLANVVDSFKDETSRSRLNGVESVSIAVKKRAGENIIEIIDRTEELIAHAEPTWPRGTEVTRLMDKSKDIRMMVADLENNILSGLALVVVVIFFALGLRNAALVSLAIPFSMFTSFIVLYVMGITLNMVVLFSLTLALGMLVDNAIVIVENIYRYMQQGVPKVQAAMRATGEVAYPVIGSTLTTLAAFSPLLFWPGIMGEFMGYLPLTLIVTLSSSLFVAMVINPALAAFFMKVKSTTAEHEASSPDEVAIAAEQPVAIKGPILKAYTHVLKHALDHRPAVVLIAFALLVLMFQVWLLAIGIDKPVEFLPHIDPKSIYVNVEPPEGADLDYVDRVVRQVEMRVNGISHSRIVDPAERGDDLYAEAVAMKTHQKAGGETFQSPSDLGNVEHVFAKSRVGATGGGLSFEVVGPNSVAVQFLDLKDRVSPTDSTVDEIRRRVSEIAGAEITVAVQEEGPPTGAAINIEISGDDFRVLGDLARQTRKVLQKVPFVTDITDDYVEGTPSIRVRIDRQRAALFGLSTSDIGFALKTGYNGLDVSTFREGDKDFDITVQLSDPNRRVTDVLRELMIPAPDGVLVPLTSLARIDYTGSLGNITRINHARTVTVKASVDETRIPGPVARAQAEELLGAYPLPPGYNVRFTGEFEFQKESEDFLGKAFIIAIFLILLILVTMFNSIVQPVIIMTAVMLSLGGAFVGLTVVSSPFGIIMTGVGVISLAGVVVNNGIVLVDYINKLRARGLDLRDALLAGGATRLRPVLLTAVTTILGLLPMVTGISYDFHNWSISWVSESSMWWRSMAIVVIFGLTVATFLTLIVVPTLYSLFDSLQTGTERFIGWTRRLYWRPFERFINNRRGL